MEEEMEELKKEIDNAKFQLNELRKNIGCENQQVITILYFFLVIIIQFDPH